MKKQNKKDYGNILAVLPKKPENKTHKQLAMEVGLKPKNFRQQIKEMRKAGIPVCSNDQQGYWMARDKEDIENMIKYYKTYVNSMNHTIRALRKAQVKINKDVLDFGE